MHASGDLVEDLTHNFFLETGARNNKLKVYEMVDHPAARALTGYLLCRGGVHQVAYARALENLTGVDMMKAFPSPRIPTDKIPECQPHIEKGEHLKLYRFSLERLPRAGRGLQRPAPGDRRGARGRQRGARRACRRWTFPRSRTCSRPTTRPEEIAEIATKLRQAAGMSEQPSGVVANNGDGDGIVDKVKDAVS